MVGRRARAQVHAALAYYCYWEHRDEIEQEIREDQRFPEKLEKDLSGAPLSSSSPV